MPTGDNPEENSRNEQFLVSIAKEEWLNELALFTLVKQKGGKKGEQNDLPVCKSLLKKGADQLSWVQKKVQKKSACFTQIRSELYMNEKCPVIRDINGLKKDNEMQVKFQIMKIFQDSSGLGVVI